MHLNCHCTHQILHFVVYIKDLIKEPAVAHLLMIGNAVSDA